MRPLKNLIILSNIFIIFATFCKRPTDSGIHGIQLKWRQDVDVRISSGICIDNNYLYAADYKDMLYKIDRDGSVSFQKLSD